MNSRQLPALEGAPARLQLGIVLAVLVLLLTVGLSYFVDDKSERAQQQHREVATGLERVVRLNQELTSVLTLAVVERNVLRTSVYDSSRELLGTTLRDVAAATSDMNLSGEVVNLLEENSQLRVLERDAIAMMHKGQWDEARALLFGDRYVMLRKVYEISSDSAVSGLQGELQQVAAALARWRQFTMGLRLSALALLLWLSWRYSRHLRRALSQQQKLAGDVARANEALEDKVEQRTAELRELNKQLAVLSATDGLTGLANRREFDAVWEAEWRRAVRHGLSLGVLMIDVDHFKSYNDHHGHREGDACLKDIAEVLRTSVRRAGELAARYGGEEFVVVMPEVTPQQAVELAESIRSAVQWLARPHSHSSAAPVVTISIGVAVRVPTRQESIYALLNDADEALYKAKRAGRNQVVRAG